MIKEIIFHNSRGLTSEQCSSRTVMTNVIVPVNYVKEPLTKIQFLQPFQMNLSRWCVPGLRSAQWFCFLSGERFLHSPETLSSQRGQPLAVHVEVDQCEGSAQVIVVLLQATEAYLHASEDALQNAERMFHLGSHPGLGPVLSSL